REGTLFEPRQPTEFHDMNAHLLANDGLPHAQMLNFAQRLGLQATPRLPRLPNLVELQNWLMIFGPIWTDGVPVNSAGVVTGGGHVVVIGGVDDRTAQMLVLDPSPVPNGSRTWRPYAHLGQILSQRNNPSRPVTFLHYPAEFR